MPWFCVKYLETRSCPPYPEDIFDFLHNYTNPRPITVQEIQEVTFSCWGRLYVLIIDESPKGQIVQLLGAKLFVYPY